VGSCSRASARQEQKRTPVVGGWRALSESYPPAGQRKAIMLSDGRGKFEKIQVDLS
jgi:hypothetical protein